MSTPSIQTLITQAQQVLNLKSSNEIRATLAAILANANVGTPLNPNLTTQQLWDEFYEIVRQPSDDIMSIITDQMMRMVFSPPAPGGAGADKQVIFNDGGVLAGDTKFLWDKTANRLDVDGPVVITGDLTVDTNVLKVDTTNNRVGIGTATPADTLDVNGRVTALRYLSSSSNAALPSFAVSAGNGAYSSGANEIGFAINSANAMTLNSTGLGIGDAPATNSRLTIGSTNATGFQYALRTTGITTGRSQIYLNNTSGDFLGGIESSVAGTSISGTAAYSGYVGTSTTNPFHIVTNGSVRATVDSSGNVGIGVTPSAWGSNYKVVQVGQAGSVYGSAPTGYYGTKFNLYNDNTNDIAITSNWVGEYRFELLNGSHVWLNKSTTGTLNVAQTLTQAMTLNASGTLLVGLTTNTGTYSTPFVLSSNTGTVGWSVGPTSASPSNFYVAGTGGAGVYLNGTAATSWTSASDERLKDIIEPIINAVAKIGSLRAVIGKFKSDENNTRKPFLIAQDIQAVLPEAVDASNPDQLGVSYTDVIPLLVAAIKELTARVQTLEAR